LSSTTVAGIKCRCCSDLACPIQQTYSSERLRITAPISSAIFKNQDTSQGRTVKLHNDRYRNGSRSAV